MQLKKTFILFLSFVVSSCSSSGDDESLVNPLELNYPATTCIDSWAPNSELEIINGNGDYKLHHPKKIYVDSRKIDFPYDKLRVWLDGNMIYFEGDFSKDKEYSFLAYFLLTDKKNQKLLIAAQECVLGPGLRFDEGTEAVILNDPNYWQE